MIVIFATIGLTLSKLVSKSGKTVETKENKECGLVLIIGEHLIPVREVISQGQ